MTTLTERVLYERLIVIFEGVHKSKEINKELGTWERNIMRVEEDEVESTCKRIAEDVTKFIKEGKRREGKLTTQQIKNKMAEELNNL